MKTSQLQDVALDWAVARCEELEVYFENGLVCLVGQPFDTYWRYWNPSADWAQGGTIIQREMAKIERFGDALWEATIFTRTAQDFVQDGPTPLIAAMRCYVASKLGDEVDVPEELSND